MAQSRQSKAASMTPLDAPGVIARLGQAVRYAFTGQGPTDWFGPKAPIPPVAPDDAGVEGRAFDYPTGYNLNITPRANEPVSFTHMRTLADSYDLMRLVIETRKDQVEKLKWMVRPIDKEKERDGRCDELEQFFAFPDKDHDWNQWLRALLEDLLVLDAPSIYVRRTKGGQPYALELIDGSTIKRVIDYTGRTPQEGPAYQQIIKGMPAVEYTRNELIYRPRNYRTHKVYGYSPVEQVIMTVNIALRRQMHQLQYYTEGNVPEALIAVPQQWTTEQIKQFQTYWDALMEGSTAQRRHAKFVPGDMKYQPTKDSTLKDMYDEWLARVVCFAFSISPQPFVEMMNRATADTANESALAEGLAPVMAWIKSTLTLIIRDVFGYADLEFAWDDEASPTTKATMATVHKTYIDAKVLTPDEVREDLGLQALTPEQREKAWPTPVMEGPPGPNGAPPGKKPPQGKAEDKGAEKAEEGAYLGKRGTRGPFVLSRVAPINRERPAVRRVEKRIAAATENALKAVAAEFCELLDQPQKADQSELLRILEQMNYSGLVALVGEITPDMIAMAEDGGFEAMLQLGLGDEDAMLSLVNEDAVAWAKAHAAELVGMKWVKGKLVPNPNATYRIDERTRGALNGLVQQALDEGWSNQRLAKEVTEAGAFSRERAELIATTETARADVAGNMLAYKRAGVTKKQWLLAQSDFCAICAENAEAGVIKMNDAFPSGDQQSPAHPKCRCDVLPVRE